MKRKDMTIDRRELMKAVAAGAIVATIDGQTRLLKASEARAQGLPFKTLSNQEARTLEAFGDILLPGAAEAGIAHYVDHHLTVPPADSFLMIRYLDVPPPYGPFYKACLSALRGYAVAEYKLPFDKLEPKDASTLVARISRENPASWQGPPAPLFYFSARSDAVDVYYGTMEGFEKLGIPYMAHIEPESRW
jgi:hypothetical protein